MSLRLVEVHRSADGGWELVRGGLKPACAAAAAAATPVTGALPAPPPDPGQPPHFRPLADLFAECLQQDSQLNAAFAGGRSGAKGGVAFLPRSSQWTGGSLPWEIVCTRLCL